MTETPVHNEDALTSTAARLLPGLTLIALLFVLAGTAWMCDDAFITFRTVKNVVSGHGLTWNPGERVQAYTHPSWMLLSVFAYALSSECFFSVLALSTCLTFATVLLLVYRLRATPLWAAAIVITLCCSRAFIEYSVCGLENPLLFLLLTLFSVWATRANAERHLLRFGLLFALIALTRSDAALIVGPCCVELWMRRPERWQAAREAALGALPLWAWELFSIIYYGSLVPNTAIAKLNVNVPQEQLFGHGAAYLVNSLQIDPITLSATLACMLLLLRGRQRRDNAVVLGCLLYLGYLLRIGGDFMSGRFCGALLVFALANLVSSSLLEALSQRTQPWLVAALAVYAAAWPGNPCHVDLAYGQGLHFADVVSANGIADERAYYYPTTGLVPVLMRRRELADLELPVPPFVTAVRGQEFRASQATIGELFMVGFYGYFAGDKHVVDRWALTDAFMARVPFTATQGFRPGHYERGYPDGYIATVTSGRNRIQDPKLARLYARVQLVITGPLFTRARWNAIWLLNTGRGSS